MSSDRLSRRFVLLGLFALGGCGFTPIYGQNNTLRGQIAYETDESVAGFRIRSRLEERLGYTTTPRYVLTVARTEQRRTSAITSDGDTTRFNVIGTATWILKDSSTDTQVETGEVEAFTGYTTTGSTTATQAAETDATERLSFMLADMVVSRLLVLSLDTQG